MLELEKLIWVIGATSLIVFIIMGFVIFAFYHNIGQKLDQVQIENLGRDKQFVQARLDEAVKYAHIGALTGGASQYLNELMLAITMFIEKIMKDPTDSIRMKYLITEVSNNAIEQQISQNCF